MTVTDDHREKKTVQGNDGFLLPGDVVVLDETVKS